MSGTTDQNPSDGAPAVCRSCRFGSGPLRDCALIGAGDIRRLVEEGPCKLDELLLASAEELLTRHNLGSERALELRDGLLSRLFGRKAILSNLGISRLPEFANWLELQLAAALDEVEEAPLEPLNQDIKADLKIEEEPQPQPRAPVDSKSRGEARCGACQHFLRESQGRCGLEYIGREGEALQPNPWWGQEVRRAQDPRQLSPACEQFSPPELGAMDPFEGLIGQQPKASRRDEAARILCLALDRLAAQSNDAMAQAALFQSHVMAGRSLVEIATSSGKSELELERMLARARQELNLILAREFAGGGPLEL